MSRVINNPIKEWKKYWTEYLWDKCSRPLFYQRMVKLWLKKEVAVQKYLPWSRVSKRAIDTYIKEKVNHRMVNDMKYNPSYYVIDITYPTIEERNIINRGYLRQIKIAESEVYNADTPTEHLKASNNLIKLQNEYKTFLTFNPWLWQQQFD